MSINKTRGFILVLFIAGLLILMTACSSGKGSVGDVINGENDLIDDSVWQVLSTDSFSIKYPNDWMKDSYVYFFPGIGDVGAASEADYYDFSGSISKTFGFGFIKNHLKGYSDSQKNQIINDARDEAVNIAKQEGIFVDEDDRVISGQNAYEYIEYGEKYFGEVNIGIIMTYYQDDFYYIYYQDLEAEFANSKEIFDAILGSFEFY